MQRLVRFARFWDLIANSGRFTNSLKVIVGDQPFENFMALSDWIFEQSGVTHKIALDRLANLVTRWLVEVRGMDKSSVLIMLGKDYAGDAKHIQSPELLQNEQKLATKSAKQNGSTAPKAQVKRQARHLESQNEA